MSNALNEVLIRDVIEEVLGRIGAGKPAGAPQARPSGRAAETSKPDCNCNHSRNGGGGGAEFGVFADANRACEAAGAAFVKLQQGGMAARQKVVEVIKSLTDANAVEWGRIELEESKIGRLDHKIEKLRAIKSVPGVEWLRPDARSGDHGIMLEEYTPFGVIAAVTPSTHSIPTLSGNIVNMVAAGNAVVFNVHPAASRCAAVAVRAFNQAIQRETGIENLCCMIEQPTLESFKTLCSNEQVRLLCVTGGPAVVKAAMQTGKRAICAGPGNPPVLVDQTACMERAAKAIISGAAYDNNLLCIGEKEVFALDQIADNLMGEMEKHGGARLNPGQLERLTKAAFTFKEGHGGGCAEPVVNKEFIGKDPVVLARAAGVSIPENTQLLFAETEAGHPFVIEEQMMPFIPVVRVQSVEEGIAAAKTAEHNYKHTSIIHSRDVEHMTAMARALDTTLFIKNGSCLAGLGSGGEGYLSFSIATPTGEGVTNPRTFTRVRRCVMVDNLRIY